MLVSRTCERERDGADEISRVGRGAGAGTDVDASLRAIFAAFVHAA